MSNIMDVRVMKKHKSCIASELITWKRNTFRRNCSAGKICKQFQCVWAIRKTYRSEEQGREMIKHSE